MRGKHFYYSLDGIRGIAAILVAMRHVRELFGPVAFAESYLAVDLFFALSGFVLGNAYDEKLRSGLSGSRFFLIRIARLYPLYIIGTLTGILAQAIVIHRDPTRHTISVTQVILSLLMLPNLGGGPLYLFNGPAWSLMFELIANIFYGWQARWLNNRRILGIMILSFVALIGCAVVTWHRHRFASFNAGMDLQTSPYGIFRVFYSFLAGLLIYRLRLQKAFWRWKIPASYARRYFIRPLCSSSLSSSLCRRTVWSSTSTSSSASSSFRYSSCSSSPATPLRKITASSLFWEPPPTVSM
jgi:peptidoglycan/LPS O-acetylase OafA/YrhL